jgi:hypothetical protein
MLESRARSIGGRVGDDMRCGERSGDLGACCTSVIWAVVQVLGLSRLSYGLEDSNTRSTIEGTYGLI